MRRITLEAGTKELAEAARLSVWDALNQFEREGFNALQTAYFMGALATAAFAVCEAAEAEAAEARVEQPTRSALMERTPERQDS